MSWDGVHFDEMSLSHDGQAAGDEPTLPAAFVEDLRLITSAPAPEPRPGLLAVMARGVPAAADPPSRRRPALFRAAAGGLAARLALGMGVAAASVTAAGAAGVLPAPAQHAVAAVVGAATPFELPDPATATTVPRETTSVPLRPAADEQRSPTTTSVAGDRSKTGAGAAGGDNHGGCVSAAATEASGAGSHGENVSTAARTDCGKSPTTLAGPPSTTATTVSGGHGTAATVRTDDANRGKGDADKGDDRGANAGAGNGGGGNGGDNRGGNGGPGPANSGSGSGGSGNGGSGSGKG